MVLVLGYSDLEGLKLRILLGRGSIGVSPRASKMKSGRRSSPVNRNRAFVDVSTSPTERSPGWKGVPPGWSRRPPPDVCNDS